MLEADMAEETVPAFKLGSSAYDQSTFNGRFYNFLDLMDPRSLLTSEKTLQSSIQLLQQYKDGSLPAGTTDADLWRAQKIKSAIIHPDTGEKIFMPLRMSGYVPFGSPITIGLLLPNPTLNATIFWQWLNMSHNAFFNYANRNATKPTPTERFVMGYFGAVGSAVSIAVGLNVFISRTTLLSASTRSLLLNCIPYPAVACANVCNVFLMRNSELSTGVEVYERDGSVVGTSKSAAKRAIASTALTRFLLPAPIIFLPQILMYYMERTRWLKANPRWNLPIRSLAIVAAFGGFLPLSVALFPQELKVAKTALEPEIQAATKDEFLYFNKGL